MHVYTLKSFALLLGCLNLQLAVLKIIVPSTVVLFYYMLDKIQCCDIPLVCSSTSLLAYLFYYTQMEHADHHQCVPYHCHSDHII